MAGCAEGRCLAAEGKLQELRANTDIEGPQLASAAGLSTEALAALPGRVKEYQAAVADIRNDVGWDVARDNALRALHRHEKGVQLHFMALSTPTPIPTPTYVPPLPTHIPGFSI